jgi:dCMP deaminase
MIINAGISRIVYEEGYADQLAAQMIAESGLAVEKFQAPEIPREKL